MELSQLIAEVQRMAFIIIGDEPPDAFSLADYDFNVRANEKEFWVEFFGFKSWTGKEDHTQIVKEVFRAICYRYNLVFIDKTVLPDLEE